jgi:hypothetical protein
MIVLFKENINISRIVFIWFCVDFEKLNKSYSLIISRNSDMYFSLNL